MVGCEEEEYNFAAIKVLMFHLWRLENDRKKGEKDEWTVNMST
jgi:starvation-inducible outer membrane lipoprotein